MGAAFMPERILLYVVETDGLICTKEQQPRNPHLGAGQKSLQSV